MNQTVDTKMIDILNNVRSEIFNSSVDDVLELCLLFAGSFAALKIIMNVIPILMNPGKEWDSAKILSPVFLVILLLIYQPMINMVRSVMGSFEMLTINAETYLNSGETFIVSLEKEVFEPVQKTISKEAYDRKLSFDEAWKMKADLNKSIDGYAHANFYGAAWDYYMNDVDSYGEIMEQWETEQAEIEAEEEEPSWFTRQFQSFMVWASSIIKSIVLNVRNTLLTIVEVGGPIAICMSFIPSLEGSFRKWFGIYIHLYLWAPICTIIDGICLATSRAFENSDVPLLGFIVSVVFLVTYILVPKITSYFIESKDQGLAMSAGINKAAGMVMSAFKGAKGMVSGGVSSLGGAGAGGGEGESSVGNE